MQIGYLTLTIGFQYFLIFGYILYGIFRKFPAKEDSVWLITWIGGMIGILTLGEVVVDVIVSTSISLLDRLPILLLIFVDLFALVIMANDVLKQREKMKSERIENVP